MKENNNVAKGYVQVTVDKIIQTQAYTAIVLKHGEKRFGIYVEPFVGRFLDMHLNKEVHEKRRPYTHDLLSSVFKMFNMRIKQVVITDVQDTVFYAHMFIEMEKDGVLHIAEIDCRPSDSIILACLHEVPIFSAPHIIQNTIPFHE